MNYRTYHPEREVVEKRLREIKSEMTHIVELVNKDPSVLCFKDQLTVDNILDEVNGLLKKLKTK